MLKPIAALRPEASSGLHRLLWLNSPAKITQPFRSTLHSILKLPTLMSYVALNQGIGFNF